MSVTKKSENNSLKDGENVVLRKKLKELRKSSDMSQKDVAEKLHIDRTVYTKYENGTLKPNQERLHKLAEIFGVNVSEFEKCTAAVIPDTSALLKNKRLLTMLLEDYDQVIIPDTVLNELDYQKNKGKNKRIAWQVMMLINEYRTRFSKRLLFKKSNQFKENSNDAKIIKLAEQLNKKLNKMVFLIHDDIGMSNSYEYNSILLKDYIAKRSNNTNYGAFLALDEKYDDLKKAPDLDLNMYLPNGMTLLISCIRCNDKNNRNERDGHLITKDKQYRKFKFLIENGCDINKTDYSCYCLTPLAHCVQTNNYELFELLLEKGADYNKGSVDETSSSNFKMKDSNEGNTPLMIACWHVKERFVKKLCSLPDISLNQQDSNGYTALIKCAVQRYNLIKEGKKVDHLESIYNYLLSLDKTDILIRDRKNRTATYWWELGNKQRKEMRKND